MATLLPIAHRLSPIASRLSPLAHHLSPLAHHLSPITSHLSPLASRLSPLAYDKPSAIQGEARLHRLERIIYSKTISALRWSPDNRSATRQYSATDG